SADPSPVLTSQALYSQVVAYSAGGTTAENLYSPPAIARCLAMSGLSLMTPPASCSCSPAPEAGSLALPLDDRRAQRGKRARPPVLTSLTLARPRTAGRSSRPRSRAERARR